MAFGEWLNRVREIDILEKVVDFFDTDQRKDMPPGGAHIRAQELGSIVTLRHGLLVDPAFCEETEKLLSQAGSLTPEQLVCVRVMRRLLTRELRKPEVLVRARAEAASRATAAWGEAKKGKGDFALFAPALKELVALSKELGAAVTTTGNPYDGVLEGFEPGLTQERALGLCEGYLARIAPFKDLVLAAAGPDTSILELSFPRDEVVAFSRGVGFRMGVDPNRTAHGVIDHPCTMEINPCDVRVYGWSDYKGFREEFTANIHEDGHALHHLGFSSEWAHTPMARSSSFGINESQSTFWERLVVPSSEFWRFYYPFLKERLPELLNGRTWLEMYRAMNAVRPGAKRIGADTLTYVLHILIRARIEAQLFCGSMAVEDIPDAWNEMYRYLLGVVPTNDSEGCLQDGHWAWGYFGYFPSYAIGLAIAAQVAEHLAAKIGLWDLVASGDFSPITAWLRTHIHQKGDTYTAAALVEEVTGSPLAADALARTMERRLTDVYNLAPQLTV